MLNYGNSHQRWPERQRAAGALKTVITATVGGSREFYRLVDMDLRRREFLLAMRESRLREDRLQEMKHELAAMTEEADRLKPIVKAQMEEIAAAQGAQGIEAVATRGLLHIALDSLVSTHNASGTGPPSVTIDRHVVTDLGAISSVQAPGGQTYRCFLFAVEDQGAGMRCEAGK